MFPRVVKSTYAQITLTRITILFFLLSFAFCLAQGLIQSFLYALDAQSETIISEIVRATEIPERNITFREGAGGNYTVKMCDNIPFAADLVQNPCVVIYRSGEAYGTEPVVQDLTMGFEVAPLRTLEGVLNGVSIKSRGAETKPIVLSQHCAQMVVYPEHLLRHSVREDLTFIILQFWLFGVSLFAVEFNSVPHLLTALGTRFLITSWSSYIVIYRTPHQAQEFSELFVAGGTPCGFNPYPGHFPNHFAYDITDAILNWIGLLLCGYLSWRLLKLYNSVAFKRVGAPTYINRIYRFFMAMLACLQLEVFVLVAGTSLWLNILTKTAIAQLAHHAELYKAGAIFSLVIVLPWLALGWYSIRRESQRLMFAFLLIAFLLVGGWGLMFYSVVYRWSFERWPLFGCFTVASFILIIASVILGALCWSRFGKGFSEYMHAEAALADSNFAHEVFKNDLEKGEKLERFGTDASFPPYTFQSFTITPEVTRMSTVSASTMSSMRVDSLAPLRPVRAPLRPPRTNTAFLYR
ncbi:hypothetical protein MKEN_01360800 [Mycena kentingensis (nom. inval.)]|nr:hypothetical protein MKEN_01360800 [Mycena kentingensis (nom. inval.)]